MCGLGTGPVLEVNNLTVAAYRYEAGSRTRTNTTPCSPSSRYIPGKGLSSISIILTTLKKSVYTVGKTVMIHPYYDCNRFTWETLKHLREAGLYFLYMESFSLVYILFLTGRRGNSPFPLQTLLRGERYRFQIKGKLISARRGERP